MPETCSTCIDLLEVARVARYRECHEEVTRRSMVEPCDRPAVAVRIDVAEGSVYPVCRRHTRYPLVPLGTIWDAFREEAVRANWDGPTCAMCGGTGIARFVPAPPADPYDARCPACNGHGQEPS